MSAFIHPEPIPENFIHPLFLFEVLQPKHVELDYQALMVSRNFLRRWSESTWPEDEFLLADNLKDLEWHFEEFKGKYAFTFTILNPSRTKCFGCIYIRPTDSIRKLSAAEKEKLTPYPYFCSYWVIDEIRSSDLERQILFSLNNWLKTSWQFPNIVFTSNLLISEQNKFLEENGFTLFLKLSQKIRQQLLWTSS